MDSISFRIEVTHRLHAHSFGQHLKSDTAVAHCWQGGLILTSPSGEIYLYWNQHRLAVVAANLDSSDTDYILGIGKSNDGVKLLLDIDKVLSTGEIIDIRKTTTR